MSGARIIQLGPTNAAPMAASFEDAFGEFSNAGGRDRRKKRKLERVENRGEIKAARQTGRANKIAGRTELQAARKAKRIGKREMGLESRLIRKEARTASKVGRRDLRNPQNVPSTESAGYQGDGLGVATTTETGVAPGTESNYVPSTQSGGYAPSTQSGGYAPSTQSGGYATSTQSNGYAPSTQSGYYEEGAENGNIYDQELIDETASNAYEMGYQDSQDDSGLDVEIGEEDQEYGDFDGIMGAEDRYNEMQDKNDMPVNPQVQNLADKCVWNEMLIFKLKNDRKNANGNPQMISKTILDRSKRLKDLKGELENYANAMGAYCNADGSEDVISQRKKAVQMALNKARRKAVGQGPINVTSVERSLKPTFSRERIEVKSNATGTGLNGLDSIEDYDAPLTREFFLGADGSFTKGIDLGSIALGALLTVGFICLNKQYKWIKL